MASFDKYTNFNETAGVSSVVFGADKPVLEVEMNEMQEIQKSRLNRTMKRLFGNGITDKKKVTFDGSKVSIASDCALIVDGYVVECTGLSVEMTSGTAYLQVWEETVDYSETLKKEGNEQSDVGVTNYFKDSRSPQETTKRKVVKYTLATSTNSARHNLAIASVSGGVMIKLVKEINFANLAENAVGSKSLVDPDVYGVEVDWKNNKFTRLSSAIGKNGGADFDNIAPWNRRRCNVTDKGKVIAYYGDKGYTETGFTEQEIIIDGNKFPEHTKVQVMVEQNMFFYKMVPLSLEPTDGKDGWKVRKAQYYISSTYKDGFKLFPAFRRGGKLVPKIYDSAFEGSLFTLKTKSYVMDDSVEPDYSEDRLSSIAGAKPLSDKNAKFTRANVRNLAGRIGYGWCQEDFLINSMTEWLFLIEYASTDAQTKIGKGVCDFEDKSRNAVLKTGLTSNLGNASGMAPGINGKTSISYRGKENPFGNTNTWVDGLNYTYLEDKRLHIYWADCEFDDSSYTRQYKDCGFAPPKTSGYVSAFGWSEYCDFAFLPVETTGDESKPVGDFYWKSDDPAYDSATCVASFGGSWYQGFSCGLFAWSFHNRINDSPLSSGGRLVYISLP